MPESFSEVLSTQTYPLQGSDWRVTDFSETSARHPLQELGMGIISSTCWASEHPEATTRTPSGLEVHGLGYPEGWDMATLQLGDTVNCGGRRVRNPGKADP